MSTIAPPIQTGNGFHWDELSKKPSRRRRSLIAWLGQWRSHWNDDRASFLTSFTVHTLLVLILALISTSIETGGRPVVLWTANNDVISDTTDLAAPTSFAMGQDDEESGKDELTVDSSNWIVGQDSISLNDVTTTSAPIDPVVQNWIPAEMKSIPGTALPKSSNSSTSSLFAASSLEGRSTENRKRLALQNGGSKESEAAVDAALAWFAAHQAVDGSWSTEMADKPCNGQCSHGTVEFGSPKKIAATGLALLCYLGAGHTHKQGDYKDVVYKAINYLTREIKTGAPGPRDFRPSGRFLTDSAQYEMYEQGIAVLAMCEAYEMTADSILRVPLETGIDFIQRSQHPDGSWGYRPGNSGDLSIVGWQMMALKSARKIGLKVRPEVIQRVDKFLDSQQSEYGAYYGYRSTKREACTTAIGLLLRLYRGWSKTNPSILKGTQYVAELGPSSDGIYYNYYATLLLFHMKYERWSEWNLTNREYLIREQAKVGHEKGSWYFGRSHFNEVGGRLYCTAMATLTLEVYYRFMPIYSEIEPDTFQL